MKKKIFSILALCLSVCFMFAGCNLLNVNENANLNATAITNNGEVLLTKEDIQIAYNNYFESYYNSYSTKAFDKLIEDLITEKLIVNEAKDLISKGEIVLTNTEKNYIYQQTFEAVLSNLENFEKDAIKILNIKLEEESKTEGDKKYVYTEYNPYASVILNSETGKYEIQIANKYLIYNESEKEYEYVEKSEYESYTEPTKLLGFSDFVYEDLTSKDRQTQAIAQEAKRLYIVKLLQNEEGKNLSTDADEVFQRELERIYEIVYKNFVSSKLYQYKTSSINISGEDVLNSYISKVKETYERYLENKDAFKKEITTSVISANMYGSYSSGNSIEDVYFVPKTDETFFMVYHIIVQFDEKQVATINEAKQKLNAGAITQDDFDKIVADEQAKIRLNERDETGAIVVKSTDDDALTFDQMLANLKAELDEATSANEKGNIFNKYLYKYGTDSGSLQVQTDYFGGEHENWYGYIVGSKDTDNNFLKEFVSEARKLYDNGNGELGSISDKFYMESWTTETKKDEDGNAVKDEAGKEVKVDKFVYGGYSVMMYAGKIANLFEEFDDNNFDKILESETSRSNALKTLSEKRLGLIGNKTLFDLVYEDIYSNNYNNIIKDLKEELNKNAKIEKFENVYKDINPFA